ncbi:MAG: hypothetical protein K8L99_11710 [Anaerolineae bacterium]|nr:hypothetical protein [Anaerolineae bacterium]
MQLDIRPTPQPRDIAPRPLTPTYEPFATPILGTPLPTVTPFIYVEPTLAPDATVVGKSVEGRSIVARQLGEGRRILMLVGGIHGGWEANTVTLMNQMLTHFDENPEDIPPGLSLVIIPAANPDGLVRGLEPAGRFNTNGVDLNRNWGCDWQADAYWRDQTVDAGAREFSEPETQALRDFILRTAPATVLFYHSAAAGVYAGTCGGDAGSILMSQLYGQAAGYTYGQSFSAYPVTGTAATWVNSMGIASADVELQTQTQSEFARNLAGVLAVIEWLAGE